MENQKKMITLMKRMDQEIRFKGVAAAQAGDPQPNIYNYMAYLVDSANNMRIRRLIELYGFPMHTTVGKDVLKDFWLLIQHQDLDIDLQKQCLENCDFDKEEYEHLEDRILINEGKAQKHGTQRT